MKRVLIATDKFKGSLTTFQAGLHIAQGIHSAAPDLHCQILPMADGGDGFQNVVQHYLHTQTIYCDAVDPLQRPIHVSYQMDTANRTAVIELAVASGLALLSNEERNPFKTSTIGTGIMIRHAIQNGCTSIILGLGGSATNDAGMGILHALGFRFYSSGGALLDPCGGNLLQVDTIRSPEKVPAVQFIIASDVQHVLHGKNGAAHGFARQKGADDEGILLLDAGLVNFSKVIAAMTGKKIDHVPGTGAAGGIAAGLMAFFRIEIKGGIEMVMELSNISSHMQAADLVITGEGKLDEQTMTGKVIAGVLRVAREMKKPVVVFCGENTLTEQFLHNLGITAVYTLIDKAGSKENAMKLAGLLLEKAAATAISNLRADPDRFHFG